MTSLEQATCVFHPGKAAASTCKQCGKTTCHQCTVTGPTGTFCSTPCRTAHEARVIQARDLDGRARSTFFVKLRGLISKLIVLLAVLAVAALIGSVIYIPYLSEIIVKARDVLGF